MIEFKGSATDLGLGSQSQGCLILEAELEVKT